MGGLLREQATWIAVAAVLVAVVTWLLLVRKAGARDVIAAGRHRADTPEPPLDSAEPVRVGAHMKTVPEPAQG